MDSKEYKTFIEINKRSTVKIDGVTSVLTLDNDEISLMTEDGIIYVEGMNLTIEDLSSSTHKILVRGLINSIDFNSKRKKGLWS